MNHISVTKHRIDILDVLRGFALLGILIMNAHFFSGFAYASAESKATLWDAPWNEAANFLHKMLISGKFHSLFSLLFGIGFALQFSKSKSVSDSFSSFYSKRMLVLMIIGIIHIWFIWLGDVLFQYSICGLGLLLVRKFSDKGLFSLMGLMIVAPGLHLAYLGITSGGYLLSYMEWASGVWFSMGLPKLSANQSLVEEQQISQIIQSGNVSDFLEFTLIGPLIRIYSIQLESRFFKIFLVFLIGFWIGKEMFRKQLLNNKSLLKRIFIWAAILGIPSNIFYAWIVSQDNLPTSLMLINEVFSPIFHLSLTFCYASAISLLFQFTNHKKWLSHLKPAGKMALTNYLMQSLICVPLFYGVGFGLSRYIGPFYQTFLCLVIFGLQLVFSRWWLSNYEFGPMEWVWRKLTYPKIARL